MLSALLPAFLAIAAGISIVIQQALNANLRNAMRSAAWSGFMSYAVGLACMALLVLAFRDPIPAASLATRIPWWAWSGGAFGAIFIGLGIFLVPQIGAATFLALLELFREDTVSFEQVAPLGELYVTWTGAADTDSVNELTESDDDE